MSVGEWTDTFGIHHWKILWSSYRKLAWVEFEPTTTDFNRLSYKAMSYSQLCTATPISSFGQCQISFRLLPSTVFLSIKEMDPVFYHYNTNVLGKILSYNGLRQKIGSISLGRGTNSGACLRFQSCDFSEGFLCSCMLRCFKPGMLRGLSIQPTW